MSDFTTGQIVFSKRGRDHGIPFIVYAMDEAFLYLVDGATRKLEKPKRKKRLHVQPTNAVTELKQKIDGGCALNNADFRKALAYLKKREGENGQV